MKMKPIWYVCGVLLMLTHCKSSGMPADEIETIQHHLQRQQQPPPKHQQQQQQRTQHAFLEQQQQQLAEQKSYDKFDDVGAGADEIAAIAEHDAVEDHDPSLADDDDQHTRYKRQLADFFIAPNTRWCGRGNTANGTYNALGGASKADKCCRRHDHCQIYIPAMSNRYELFNYRPYTLSYCNCDSRFRTCLKLANDDDATTIGKLFFNMVQTQCFRLKKVRVCLKRAADGQCEQEHEKVKAYLVDNKKF